MEEVKNKFSINNWKLILISFCISFSFLLLCSNNSFLYAFNDNQDINWYITMGNGLLDGKIPYKDLYEQKGPLVFIMFSLFCLFKNPYRVAFIVEVICFTIFLFFSYKIIIKFFKDKIALLSLLLIAFFALTSTFFVVGGGAIEEYCLPMFSYMLFCFIEHLYEKKPFTLIRSLVWGILIGIILFSKFTLLVFPFIVYIYLVIDSIRNKKIKELVKISLMFVAGAIIVICPIIVFFALNGALLDLFEVYFYNNIFLYGGYVSVFYKLLVVFVWGIIEMSVVILGMLLYFKKRDLKECKYTYVIVFVSYLLILLITGNYSYYFLPIIVFMPLSVAYCLEYIIEKFKILINRKTVILGSVCLFVLTFIFANGTIEMFNKKNDYIHFQIAKDIRDINEETPTLFCYKLWDYGFYNVLEVVPNVKYYANNLFDENTFKEMYDEFDKYIVNKETEFLLVDKEVYKEEREFINNYYSYHKEYSYTYYKDNLRKFKMQVVLLIRK